MHYSFENDPLRWSHLAEEARAMAEGMIDSGAKRTLNDIAQAYDALAKRAEEKTIGK